MTLIFPTTTTTFRPVEADKVAIARGTDIEMTLTIPTITIHHLEEADEDGITQETDTEVTRTVLMITTPHLEGTAAIIATTMATTETTEVLATVDLLISLESIMAVTDVIQTLGCTRTTPMTATMTRAGGLPPVSTRRRIRRRRGAITVTPRPDLERTKSLSPMC